MKLFRRVRPFVRPNLETLEDRTVLSTMLYVDFGDRFGGSGVLTSTVGALKNTKFNNNPTVDGPQLYDSFFNEFPDNTTFRLTRFNNVWTGNDAAARAEIMTMVRRFFEPLDITVVELTSQFQTVNGFQVRGAANLNEVSATLGLNETEAKNNDAYVLIGRIAIGNTNYNPALDAYGGIATGTDIGQANNNDGTALVLLTGLGFDTTTFLANQIAHEAAHTLGLRHTFGNFPSTPPFGSNIDATLPESDIMSYRAYDTFGGLNFFTRFPMVAGDGNLDNNVLSAALGASTPFDQMAVDPNIGANPNMSYVTGTGAHDVITITVTGVNEATVRVEAFSSSTFTGPIAPSGHGGTGSGMKPCACFHCRMAQQASEIAGPPPIEQLAPPGAGYGPIPVPSLGGTVFTYTIPLDRPIRIDGGARGDRFVIDARIGQTITIYGMDGDDELVVLGNQAGDAVYTPGTHTALGVDGRPDRRGTITIGGTTIQFQEFELASLVTIEDVSSLTFRSPGGKDVLQLLDTAGVTSVTGTISDGLDFVPFAFRNVPTFTLDLANNDGSSPDDEVTLNSPLSTAGLQHVRIQTGAGNDKFILETSSLALPVAGGGFTFDAGEGDDVVETTLSTFDLTAGSTFRFEGGAGNDALLLSKDSVTLGDNATLEFLGGEGDDRLELQATNVALSAGAKVDFLGDSGADVVLLAKNSMTLQANSLLQFLAGDGNDILRLPGNSLTLANGATLTFDAGNDDDRLEIPTTKLSLPNANSFQFLAGPGSDTVAATSGQARTWTILGVNVVDLNGMLTFQGVENLLGDGASDTFIFRPNGRFEGVIDGGRGQDVLNLSAFQRITLNIGAINALDGYDVVFGGPLTGNVRSINEVIAHPARGDVFQGLNVPSTWEYRANGVNYSAGGGELTLLGFDILRGGASSDQVTVAAPFSSAAPSFDGGAGMNTMRVLGTAGADRFVFNARSVVINGRSFGLSRITNLQVLGGAGNDTFTSTAAALSVRQLNLYGEAGNDRFVVTPAASTILNVFGGVGTDVLNLQRGNVSFAGARPSASARSGRYNFVGRLWINYKDIERVTGNRGLFVRD